MTFNVAVGVLVCVVCLVLTGSIIVLIKAQEVHHRSLEILTCAYDWLEQIRSNEKEKTE